MILAYSVTVRACHCLVGTMPNTQLRANPTCSPNRPSLAQVKESSHSSGFTLETDLECRIQRAILLRKAWEGGRANKSLVRVSAFCSNLASQLHCRQQRAHFLSPAIGLDNKDQRIPNSQFGDEYSCLRSIY